MQPDSFDRLIRINLTGCFNGISAFAPGMASGAEAHVVTIAAMAGLIAMPHLGAYVSSKSGVVGMSGTLRLEPGPHGVGVSVVCPGQVKTRLAETTRAAGSERLAELLGPRPGGVVLDPLAVGQMIVRGILEGTPLVSTYPPSRTGVQGRAVAIEAA